MIGYIYKTTNTVNNKIYIGQHHATEYDNNYIGSGPILKKAINKYGKDNFINEILEICETEEELHLKEEYWILTLNARDHNIGYNIAKGGQWDTTADTIAIYKGDEEIKTSPENLSYWLEQGYTVGRKPSTCDNLSKAIKAWHDAGNDGMRGKHQSEFQKFRARNQKKWKSEHAKKAMSIAHSDKILMSHDTLKGIYIEPELQSEYEAKGYYRGRRKK